MAACCFYAANEKKENGKRAGTDFRAAFVLR